ncbi:solute carrier family 22 member 15-like isoform X1 [Clavelina lepadiformis]|uniref:solute carrier family 22 member 15-like isoform X1 n=2 Tax=Clavelina lepadiformis TaxID=159417 RepID=UPI0040415088
MRSIDTLLEDCIGNGRYQAAIISLVLLVGIPAAFMQTATVFIAALPDARCWIEALDNDTASDVLSEDVIKSTLIPYDEIAQRYDRCHMFKYNLTGCEGNLNISQCVDDATNSTSPNIGDCQDGHYFNKDIFESTVATEWDLLCGRLTLKSGSTSVFYFGVLAGSIIGGALSDRFGRILVYKIGLLAGLVAGIAVAFSPNYYVFSLLRFLLALLYKPASLAAVVYALEVSRERWKTTAALGYNIIYGLGCVIMSGLAIFWRNWRPLQIAFSLGFLPLVLTSFFLPESPRWLVSKEKFAEADKTLKLMRKRNHAKGVVDLNTERDLAPVAADKREVNNKDGNSLIETFSRPYSRMMTINNMFVWMITSLVYYGISLNSGALAGNIYVNHALGGAMDIIAISLCIVAISKFGCRNCTVMTLVLCGLSCLLSTVALHVGAGVTAIKYVGLVLAMSGRFGSSAAFAVLFVHTVELFPTSGRNTALGLASMAARIGSIITPFTLQIQYQVPWLTQAIFGFTALAAACVAYSFPETKDNSLLMTFNETEKYFEKNLRSSKMATIYCISGKRDRDPDEASVDEEDAPTNEKL